LISTFSEAPGAGGNTKPKYEGEVISCAYRESDVFQR
jgi:hypothetical protein